MFDKLRNQIQNAVRFDKMTGGTVLELLETILEMEKKIKTYQDIKDKVTKQQLNKRRKQ